MGIILGVSWWSLKAPKRFESMLSRVKCISRESNCNGSPKWINGKEHYSSVLEFYLCRGSHKATNTYVNRITTFRCRRRLLSIHLEPDIKKNNPRPRSSVQHNGDNRSYWGLWLQIFSTPTLHIYARRLRACTRAMSLDFATLMPAICLRLCGGAPAAWCWARCNSELMLAWGLFGWARK